MSKIEKNPHRPIIEDFAQEIQKRKKQGAKPSREVTYFRNEHIDNIEREVWEVPIDILRFRKDNGRIASDVMSWEKDHGLLTEDSKEAQAKLLEFLEEKDPEKTNELMNSMLHSGQREPAIITADGFLINGNRRKMALHRLWEEYNKSEKYLWMKVVILPGNSDAGGPPTLKEIEQIENRYQLQSEGKSEYYKFDRALSMRRKESLGMTLEEQLRDDPNFAKMAPAELKKEEKKWREEYLDPLQCIDRYLELLGWPGLYRVISTGMTDKEGRWQAFRDYSNLVRKKLDNEQKRINELRLEEDEIGDVEEIAFKIIRKRDFPELPKVHVIMRELPKWLANNDSKKQLMDLLDIDFDLLETEKIDSSTGKEFDERKQDQRWGAKYGTRLIRQVKKAKTVFETESEKETPKSLLEAALKKLEHDKMDLSAIDFNDYEKVRDLLKKIQTKAGQLESELFNHKQSLKKLQNRS